MAKHRKTPSDSLVSAAWESGKSLLQICVDFDCTAGSAAKALRALGLIPEAEEYAGDWEPMRWEFMRDCRLHKEDLLRHCAPPASVKFRYGVAA